MLKVMEVDSERNDLLAMSRAFVSNRGDQVIRCVDGRLDRQEDIRFTGRVLGRDCRLRGSCFCMFGSVGLGGSASKLDAFLQTIGCVQFALQKLV